jgi:quercetin dioxygenase-like cupin family protein
MTRNFYTLDAYVQTEIRPGLSGAVIGGERSTAVRWEFPPDMERTGIHQHDEHEQFGVVVDGQIELEIDGIVSRLGPGEMYYVPKGVPHGGTVVLGDDPAVVIDFFSPPREEYVRAANGGPAFDPVANSKPR